MTSPLKISLKSEFVSVIIIMLAFLTGIYFYAHFPDRVIIHWNAAGQANGYSGKLFGAFFVPALIIVIYGLLTLLPWLDPKKERYSEFQTAYQVIKTIIIVFMFGIFIITGLVNLGYPVNIALIMPLAVGALFMVMGNYLGKIKSNWFMGLRNPWTLSSENVWNKTHRFGGWLFMIYGLLLVFSAFLPRPNSLAVLIIGLIITIGGSTVYSYLQYREERRAKIS